MCGLLVGLWSITLILEHLFSVFYFYKGAWSDTFNFWFLCILSCCPLWTTLGSGVTVSPLLPWGPQSRSLVAYLVFPGIHYVSFIRFWFFLEAPLYLLSSFSGKLAWCVLGVFWNAFLARSGLSLARLPKYFLLGEILSAGRDKWTCEPIFNWSWPPSLDWVCFLTLFIDVSWRTDWHDQGYFRNQQVWLSRRRDFLQSSYWICRSYVLLNSRPSSLWSEDVSVTVFDKHRRSRRDNILALVIKISRPYYLIASWLFV